MVKNPAAVDFIRELRNTRSRFISIVLLLTLASAFYSGLRAAQPDMQSTADAYYDHDHMYDIRIQSDLGLSDDDIASLDAINGVSSACGGFSFDVLAEAPDDDIVVNIMTLPSDGTNSVELSEGRLPLSADECAVDTRAISMLGLKIGDTLSVTATQDGFEDVLNTRQLLITGTITSPVFINRTTKGISTLGNGSVSAYAAVTDSAIDADYYTDAYIHVDGSEGLPCYSDKYTDLVSPVETALTDAGDRLLKARRDRLVSDAKAKVADAQHELNEKKADADSELADARKKLDDAQQKVADGKKKLDDSQKELDDKKSEGLAEINDALNEIDSKLAEYETKYANGTIGSSEYSMASAFLKIKRADVNAEKMKLDMSVDDAQTEINKGRRKLQDSEADLADAENEYNDKKDEADRKISDAQEKIDNANRDIEDIPDGKWYVTDREDNTGYSGYRQDSERMGALAAVFPMIFFFVAALVCLTTMTRMVEDNRIEIGTYKALGYGPFTVSAKYVGYGLAATAAGVAAGTVTGMLFIPRVIMDTYRIMYDMPYETLVIYPRYVLESLSVAIICTVGSTLIACLATLTERPSSLMRPQAPRPGRRVLLEYISPLWKHMSFFAKVSSRNLLRYKKRFIMTIAGIGGCTALILTGFGLRSSIMSITDMQFLDIWRYNAQVYIDTDAVSSDSSALYKYLGSNDIAGFTSVRNDSVTFEADGVSQPGYCIAPEKADGLNGYIEIRHRHDDQAVSLDGNGVVITEKLSELLKIKKGDHISITLDDTRYDAVVDDVVENYVNHYAYLNSDAYQSIFNKKAVMNELLVKTSDSSDTLVNRVSSKLLTMKAVNYVATFNNISENFRRSMGSINYVVGIILFAAAALAFVVLYNLMNINITERRRELATIKVLGFFDREVTWYIVRENIALSAIGIAAGLIGGKYLLYWLITSVEVDIVMFNRTTGISDYILAALMTAIFSVIVNIIGHMFMKSIDMVESLKTNE